MSNGYSQTHIILHKYILIYNSTVSKFFWHVINTNITHTNHEKTENAVSPKNAVLNIKSKYNDKKLLLLYWDMQPTKGGAYRQSFTPIIANVVNKP